MDFTSAVLVGDAGDLKLLTGWDEDFVLIGVVREFHDGHTVAGIHKEERINAKAFSDFLF